MENIPSKAVSGIPLSNRYDLKLIRRKLCHQVLSIINYALDLSLIIIWQGEKIGGKLPQRTTTD